MFRRFPRAAISPFVIQRVTLLRCLDNLGTAVKRFLFLLALAPSLTWAWGPVGHEVVCEIAFQELEGRARREVGRLVHLDDEYATFSAACNWADEPRKRPPDHYVNLTRAHRAVTEPECPKASSCLFTAIDQDIAVLSDPDATDAQKLEALKFLGHWVGDIHQPMHVSYQDDRGANSIEVQADYCEGSLHYAWDECLIKETLGDESRPIADGLLNTITDDQRTAWRYDSPAEWANESYQISTASAAEYCVWRDGACWYDADNMQLQRGEERRVLRLNDDYLDLHRDTVAERLKQAGVRLGALLNAILNQT